MVALLARLQLPPDQVNPRAMSQRRTPQTEPAARKTGRGAGGGPGYPVGAKARLGPNAASSSHFTGSPDSAGTTRDPDLTLIR